MKPGVDLKVDVPAHLPLVIGDRARIVQIAHNLLSNASKFTEAGSVTLRVRETAPAPASDLRMLSDAGGGGEGGGDNHHQQQSYPPSTRSSIELSVTDTGIGVSADKLETVWEPFQQADETIAQRFGGNGLGLAIVRDLTLAQNGALRPGGRFDGWHSQRHAAACCRRTSFPAASCARGKSEQKRLGG